MSEGKKRKAGYIDRAQTLSSSRKMPNVAPGVTAVPCQLRKKYTFACKFKHKLTAPQKDTMLDAVVLENGICVLIAKGPIVSAQSVTFSTSLNTEGISGRMKKGAQNVKSGASICKVTFESGETVDYVTPVGGKLLELNENVLSDPHLLESASDSKGYLAVIYPDTEIPSLDGYPDYQSLVESCAGKLLVKGVCFDFQQGSCSRGDSCRFKHK
jgi:hypothetical protein